jgi:hypothetical protein
MLKIILFYIENIFSDWVTVTPVNVNVYDRKSSSGYFKIKFLKVVQSQKKLYLNEVVRILTGHPVYAENHVLFYVNAFFCLGLIVIIF